ncbi:MAG TPA: conjugal transfer protein TraF [Planctomycetota bacterium]|nr:conjugal transfer protein TraF [Planctomycetota bacterium]
MPRPTLLALLPTVSLVGAGVWGHLAAMDAYIVGPRAFGMGGTGVASTNDQTAQFYNPALFGFYGRTTGPDNQDLAKKSWGTGLDVSAGYRVHGDLPELVDILQKVDVQGLRNNGITSEEDLRALVRAGAALNDILKSSNAVSADANAGVSVRIGHAALGVRVYGQAATLVNGTDLANVALSYVGATAGADLADAIVNNTGTATDNQVLLMSTAQRDSLYSRLGGTGAFGDSSTLANQNATQAVQRIDYQMRQAGLNSQQVTTTVTLLQNAAQGTGQGLDENDTVMRIRGFGLAEVPLSYGWAIDDHWSIGGSLKLMIGRVSGAQVSVFKDGALESLQSAPDNAQTTVNWGLDLSVAGRWEWFQAGIIGRNLNSPTFDGFTNQFAGQPQVVEDVRVDPQVAVGVAFVPWTWLTVALDADLIPGEASFNGYETQRIGLGLEVNPWNILALRAGVYKNIAEGDIGPVATLGAGLNLWALRIDLSVAASMDRTEIEGYNVPDELRASFALTVDF